MEQLKKGMNRNVTGRRITDQFYVDGDVNVPDAKSDIGRIVYSQGRLKIDDRKVVENYVRVSGRILYQILYVTDDGEGRLAGLQGKLPFEEMVYTEEEPKGTILLKNSDLELSVSLVHSRKVSLKAMVELELSSEYQAEEQLTLDVEEEPGLYRKWVAKELLALQLSKKDTCRIKEEFTLPGTRETIGNVLISQVENRRLDTRLGEGELLIRGELQVFLLYESLEGKIDWMEQTVGYESRIDCAGVSEEMYHQLSAELSDETMDVRMDEDGELRIIGVEATLEVQLTVYREEKLEILQDVYSLKQQVQPTFETVLLSGLVMQKSARYKLAEQVSIPELQQGVLQICHTGGHLKLDHTEIVAEGILAEGVLHLELLYVKADDEEPFDMWQGMVPFTYVIECEGIEAGMQYNIETVLEQLNVGLLGNGEAEVKAALGFQVFLSRPEEICNISAIETKPLDLEALERAPGIVGYTVKEGDELWNLAKHYHTSLESICGVNGLEGDPLKPGEKILIFKENIGIL